MRQSYYARTVARLVKIAKIANMQQMQRIEKLTRTELIARLVRAGELQVSGEYPAELGSTMRGG
jgi:hypothetical protein